MQSLELKTGETHIIAPPTHPNCTILATLALIFACSTAEYEL